MATNSQLAKIHIAKKELNISDENYYEILSGWNVKHANELSYNQAEELLKALQKIGFEVKHKEKDEDKDKDEDKKPIVIKVPENRPEEFASQSQINMLAGMWYERSNQKTKESFIKFVKHVTGLDAIEWLQKTDVRKVKKAIESLRHVSTSST